MKDESEPVTSDEWLIRRVHKDAFRTEKTPYISPNAFRPRTKGDGADVDGISMFRLACLKSPEEILGLVADPAKRDAIGLVQIKASEIVELKMSVAPTSINEICGHVSIPEMDVTAWNTNRSHCKERMAKLAEIASQADRILRDPYELA